MSPYEARQPQLREVPQPEETPQERRERHLTYAVEVEAIALRTDAPSLQRAYLQLARSWRDFAATLDEVQ